MPILRNPRHEKFAQELAAGKSAAEAYQRAGYIKNFGNCIRLKGNERVAARVAELQHGGAVRAEVTVASVLGELEETRKLALKRGQASAAVQCTMGKAKICGLIIDRREVGDVGAFDNLTDEQLVEEAWRRARELGIAGPRLVEDDNKRSPQAGAEGPTSLPRHVCFTPESGHVRRNQGCPLWANSGHKPIRSPRWILPNLPRN
jgi:hypothetical protein